MTFQELMKTRHSCRAFLDKPVEEEKLNQILEAGRLAPSASNRQPWKFVVVTDAAVRHALAAACYDQPATKNAPVLIAVCSDLEYTMACGLPSAPMDCSIALTCMILQGSELGISSCWLGKFDQDKVKEALNVPEEYTVYSVTPFGYSGGEPRITTRKEQSEILIKDKF